MRFLNRAQESFTTTGTGALTFGGAPSGWRTFAAALNADFGLSGSVAGVAYFAVAADESTWEFGYGTVDTAAGTITRTLIASSTGSLINWPVGTKYIFSTPEAVTATNQLAHFRGATAPPAPRAGYVWADTSGGVTAVLLKYYDGADWITLGTINETANTFTPSGVHTGDLSGVSDNVVLRKDGSGQGVQGSAITVADSGNISAVLTGATEALRLYLLDSTAGEGPSILLLRESASPAAGDILSVVQWAGANSVASVANYANIYASILDATNGSEDGQLVLRAMTGGNPYLPGITLGPGVQIGSPTGGDPGIDKVNSKGYQLDGTALPIQKKYTSADQTITAGGSLTLAHGLGAAPIPVVVQLVAVNSVLGYTAGDVVNINPGEDNQANTGVSIVPDATNLNVRFGSSANTFSINRKDTGAAAAITNTDWSARFSAYA